MKKVDMSHVKEAGESKRLPAGAYVCQIKAARDVADKEYLKVIYDIAEGEFAGHFSAIRTEHPDWEWVGAYVKSYKSAALPMFKRFCSAVSKSNGGFVFDGGSINADESTLTNKYIGLILREEEYYSNSGDIRTRLVVHSEFPVDKLADQKIPEVKRLKKETNSTAPVPTDFMAIPEAAAEEIPF